MHGAGRHICRLSGKYLQHVLRDPLGFLQLLKQITFVLTKFVDPFFQRLGRLKNTLDAAEALLELFLAFVHLDFHRRHDSSEP